MAGKEQSQDYKRNSVCFQNLGFYNNGIARPLWDWVTDKDPQETPWFPEFQSGSIVWISIPRTGNIVGKRGFRKLFFKLWHLSEPTRDLIQSWIAGPHALLWFSRSGLDPENWHFQEGPSDADAAGPGTTLWVLWHSLEDLSYNCSDLSLNKTDLPIPVPGPSVPVPGPHKGWIILTIQVSAHREFWRSLSPLVTTLSKGDTGNRQEMASPDTTELERWHFRHQRHVFGWCALSHVP